MATNTAKDNGDYLLGEKRDRVLDAVKKTLKWSAIPEKDQQMLNSDVEQVVREIIREITPVVAGRDFPSIVVTVSSLKEDKDGNLEAKLMCQGTTDNLLKLWNANDALLVMATPTVFMGAKPAEVLKDQPELMPDEAVGLGDGETIDNETGEIVPGRAPRGHRGKRMPPKLPPPADHPGT